VKNIGNTLKFTVDILLCLVGIALYNIVSTYCYERYEALILFSVLLILPLITNYYKPRVNSKLFLFFMFVIHFYSFFVLCFWAHELMPIGHDA